MENVNTKNLYIKSWYLSELLIEERLAASKLHWKRIDRQFFFAVTPTTYDDVLDAIGPLNQENGSKIHESDIDYVNATEEEIEQQLNALYGENVVLSIVREEV
ncbi:hypothetical protein GZH47_31835 (plasmid) [Paenibacillus rhizovicinus]|uniref:Uncharacterized protein n=2 Tax=Paenibacillus rhizovicinus TaxID=2704463 RepID=A0A6C0PB81_9BACL|nr:hypothetical protein GZH47_31835 [Paenibacillus rhizovicinus]